MQRRISKACRALRRWMRANDKSCADVAGALWVSRQAVQLWAAGRRCPSLAIRAALEKYSSGEISRRDW